MAADQASPDIRMHLKAIVIIDLKRTEAVSAPKNRNLG